MLNALTSPEALAVGRTPLITVGYLLQLILSLVIVIGLIYFSAKYILPRIQLPSQGRSIEIVDRIGLEPQLSAYIIKAQGKSYLIVAGAKGVSLIDKLESGS